MSGIVGIWNLDGEPLDPHVLSRMSASLAHRGPDGEGRKIAGSLGLSQQHTWITREEEGEFLPLESASGALLVMDGRIDNRDELLASLALTADASDAACVLAAYDAWGDRFVERLNGDFAVALFDPRAHRLMLARDGIGARALYYVHDGRLFAFASEIKALLVHPRVAVAPDNEGLADYLLQNSRPINRQDITCFKGVSSVVPAHLLVVTRERAVSRRYWDFDKGRAIRLGSFAEYGEAYREHFTRAVKRRIRSSRPATVSTSGGFDSSAIFCAGEQLRRRGEADCPELAGIAYLGLEGSEADERGYLLDIEAQFDVAIERFPMAAHLGLVDGADDQVRSSEAPFLDFMWGVQRELCRRAATKGRMFLSGHWGDQVLFSSAYLVDLLRQGSWLTIGRHLREYDRWLDPGTARFLAGRSAIDAGRWLLPHAWLPALKRVRRRFSRRPPVSDWFSERFREEGLALADQPVLRAEGFHSAQAWSLYLEARSKYHVHCLEWNCKIAASFGLTAAFPFLDRDLLEFMMAVPGEVQNLNGVPRALAREGMRGVLPESVRMRRWKAMFTDFVNQGLARDSAILRRLLSEDAVCVQLGLVDGARLSAGVERLLTASAAAKTSLDAWDVGDLFSLEMWCQAFMAGTTAADSRSASSASQTFGSVESVRA